MPRGGPEQGKEDRGRPGLGSRDRIPVKDISSMIQVFDSIFFFFFFFCTHGIWNFPAQKQNLSCSCNYTTVATPDP